MRGGFHRPSWAPRWHTIVGLRDMACLLGYLTQRAAGFNQRRSAQAEVCGLPWDEHRPAPSTQCVSIGVLGRLARHLPLRPGRNATVNSMGSKTPEPSAANGNASPPQPVQTLLIVEPESLIRWSLVTYLAKWFKVYAADSGRAANRFLDEHGIDAAIVSDDLPGGVAEEIEARARSLNSSVRLVCTVTNPPGEKACARTTQCLEKPFELAELANLLGVHGARLE